MYKIFEKYPWPGELLILFVFTRNTAFLYLRKSSSGIYNNVV